MMSRPAISNLVACLVYGMAALGLSGCTAPAQSSRMHATINDVSGGEGDNAGYRVTAVDGKPVERASSKTQTLVPVAVIEPGTRSISLEPRYDQKLQPRTIQANFEAGKRYRLHSQNGQVAVVEETPAPQIPPASRR